MSASTRVLLDEVVAFLRRYQVMSEEQLTASALWVLHTHTFQALGIPSGR